MNEDRLDKLDNAFLFIVSFVGLLITVVQVSLFGTGIMSLVEILPLLFLGMGVPLYIGYLRGAISMRFVNRSVAERMRGWVYLITGVSGYFGFIFAHGQADMYQRWAVLYSLAAVGLVLIFVLQRGFIKVLDVGNDIFQQYSFFGTISPAFFSSFVLRMLVSLISDLSRQPFFQLSLLDMFLFVFFVWLTWVAATGYLLFEKVSRDVLKVGLHLNSVHLQRRRHHNFLARLFLLNIDIYSFVRHCGNLKIRFSWRMGTIFGILGCCLFFISGISQGFLSISIFLFGLGTYYFWTEEINFSRLGHS